MTNHTVPCSTHPSRPTLTATYLQTYEATVLLRLELQMLAGADVFSGTFSSNLGRIVALMRHTLHKPEQSTLSVDGRRWFPARKRRMRMM